MFFVAHFPYTTKTKVKGWSTYSICRDISPHDTMTWSMNYHVIQDHLSIVWPLIRHFEFLKWQFKMKESTVVLQTILYREHFTSDLWVCGNTLLWYNYLIFIQWDKVNFNNNYTLCVYELCMNLLLEYIVDWVFSEMESFYAVNVIW